jgi:dihydrofolate reductase
VSRTIDAVRRRKQTGDSDLRTIGSLSLVQQFLRAGLVDRLRLMLFPLVIGETGEQPMFRQVGDFELHLQGQTLLDDRIVLLDYRPGGEPPYAA